MLIKALNEYYDILARNDKVCKDGFSRQNITHMIMLRKDGTVSDIINVEQESEPDSKGKTKLQPISVGFAGENTETWYRRKYCRTQTVIYFRT